MSHRNSNLPGQWDKKVEVCELQIVFSSQEPPQTKWHWILEHVLYPAIKKHLLPSQKLFDSRAVLEIASLPKLFKVFERC